VKVFRWSSALVPFGSSSGLVGRRARPGCSQQPCQPGPGRNNRDPLVSRDRVIKMSPLPVRAGRATPGEDPARTGLLELPERAARRRQHGYAARGTQLQPPLHPACEVMIKNPRHHADRRIRILATKAISRLIASSSVTASTASARLIPAIS
jgi:hypothetical protein